MLSMRADSVLPRLMDVGQFRAQKNVERFFAEEKDTTEKTQTR